MLYGVIYIIFKSMRKESVVIKIAALIYRVGMTRRGLWRASERLLLLSGRREHRCAQFMEIH